MCTFSRSDWANVRQSSGSRQLKNSAVKMSDLDYLSILHLNVLVVDDNPTNIAVCERIMKLAGCKVRRMVIFHWNCTHTVWEHYSARRDVFSPRVFLSLLRLSYFPKPSSKDSLTRKIEEGPSLGLRTCQQNICRHTTNIFQWCIIGLLRHWVM